MTQRVLAVTTRSRLRGVRLFPLMFFASLRIRRQLAATPGVVRWASIVAGPREFWTITVWENRDKMLDFMRSGAHEDIMWLFGKWLESFWLMRWRPTPEERGHWDGQHLGVPETSESPGRQLTEQKKAALDAALDALPTLKAATDERGAPTYDTSPAARRSRRQVAGGAALIARIRPRRWRDRRAVRRDWRMLRHAFEADEDVLRWVSGVGQPHERFVLAVLRDERACDRFLNAPACQRLAERWPDDFWVMRWDPANEFGHWDGLRLRKQRLGTAIPVPSDAASAAKLPQER